MSLRDNPAYKRFDLIKFEDLPKVRVRPIDSKTILIYFALTLIPLIKTVFPWSLFEKGPFETNDVTEKIPTEMKFLDEPTLPDTVDVLVTVNSHISEYKLRNEIRASWANSSNFDPTLTTVIFVLGRPSSNEDSQLLKEENDKHGDLLILDVEDGYYFLSLKTYGMLYYKSERLPGTKCLIKADSDNVLHLFHYEVLCEETKASLIMGRCDIDRRVKRINSKWAIPFSLYKEDNWPRYCSTGTYVFCGKNIPKEIMKGAKKTKFFSSVNYRRLPEDVLFTGIFAEIAGIRRKNVGGISFRDQPDYACRDVKFTLSIHMHRRKNPIYYYRKMNSLVGTTCLI